MNLADAYESPFFNRRVDQATGYRTRSMLCAPIFDRQHRPFAVAQLINKKGGVPFDARDEAALGEFAASIGVILESWCQMEQAHKATDAR
jgi:adenylate cyclase